MCTLGREQQYFLNAKGQIWDQPRSAIRLARASLMVSALAHRRLSTSSRDSLARASLMASPPTLYFFPRLLSWSLPHGVGVGSPLLLPKTPWLEPPSWRRRWLAAESLSLLDSPSQELIYVNMQLTQPDLAGGAYRTARIGPM